MLGDRVIRLLNQCSYSQVAGGSPRWQVAGGKHSKGNRKPGLMLRALCTQANYPVPGLPLSSVSLWSSRPRPLPSSIMPPLPTCQLVNRPASCRSCQLAHWSTGQLIVSPCPLAHVPPRGCTARHKKTRHSHGGSIGPGYPVPERKAD